MPSGVQLLKNNIQLLQGYYRFLSLGKYLEFTLQSKDLSEQVPEVSVVTGQNSRFALKGSMIKTLLKQIHSHPEQKNVFGYLIEVSSFRGIFSIMRELLDSNDHFQEFVEFRLKEQAFSFEQIIRLLRNVLSHTMTTDLLLKTEDFIKQKDFLSHEKDPLIRFQFVYAKHWKEWKGSSDYGIDLTIDFRHIKDGQSFFELISLHQLYLLSELCYNLCEVYRAITFPQKTSKIVGKGSRKK